MSGNFGVSALLTSSLFFLSVAACLEGSQGTWPAPVPLREGDVLVYSYFGHNEELNSTLAGPLELRIAGLREMLGPDGRPMECRGLDVSAFRSDPEHTTQKSVCLDPESLEFVASISNETWLGLPHSDYHFSWGSALEWDGRKLPLSSLVFSEPKTQSSPLEEGSRLPPGASGVVLSWKKADQDVQLHGEVKFLPDGPESSLVWDATYTPEFPLPKEISFRATNISNVPGGGSSTFSISLNLTRYEPGNGPPIIQVLHERNDSTEPSSEPPLMNWQELLDPGPPHTRYALAEAWNYARARDQTLAAFVEQNPVRIPAAVVYESIKENRGVSFAYEWNITACNPTGSCYAARTGERHWAGGLTTQYVVTEGHPDRISKGFEGNPLSLERAENLSEKIVPSRDVAETYQRFNPDLKIRMLQFSIEPFLAGSSTPMTAERQYPLFIVNHGTITRRDQTPVTTPLMSTRLILSYFDGFSGDAIAAQALSGAPPPEFLEDEPIHGPPVA